MAVVIGESASGFWLAVDERGEVLDLWVQRRPYENETVKLKARTPQETRFRTDALVKDKLAPTARQGRRWD
jgi:hypothetical protein